MAVLFIKSADKHGIPHHESIYAMAQAAGHALLEERMHAFVGHPHPGALPDNWLEVLAKETARDAVIFHSMPLTDKFSYLLYEPNGDEHRQH